MTGETDLSALIAHMRPILDPDAYVFCSFNDRSIADLAGLAPLCLFAEAEGVTAILPVVEADKLGLGHTGHFRRITLTVHSSLEAVGLTAAVSTALATAGIPANIVAAYFHDHVFVPASRAEEAVRLLQELAESAGA